MSFKSTSNILHPDNHVRYSRTQQKFLSPVLKEIAPKELETLASYFKEAKADLIYRILDQQAINASLEDKNKSKERKPEVRKETCKTNSNPSRNLLLKPTEKPVQAERPNQPEKTIEKPAETKEPQPTPDERFR